MSDQLPPRDTLPVRTPGFSLIRPTERPHTGTMPPAPTCDCPEGSPIPPKQQ